MNRFDLVHHHVHSAALSLRYGRETGRKQQQSIDFARWHLRRALSEANRSKHQDRGRVLAALSKLQTIEGKLGLGSNTGRTATAASLIGAAVLIGCAWVNPAHAATREPSPSGLAIAGLLTIGALAIAGLISFVLRPRIVADHQDTDPPTFV